MGILNLFRQRLLPPHGSPLQPTGRGTPSPAAALLKPLRAGATPPAFAQQPMNLIQVPDLSRKLVTRYGIREKAPAPTLATEVVPVVLVDDLIGESDLIRPRIRPAAGVIEFTAAAQTPCFGLVNPTGSRVVAHVYYIIVTNTALAIYDVHFTGTPATGSVGTAGFRNGLMPAQAPACSMQGVLNVGSPGGVIEQRWRCGANLQIVVPYDAVLDEGQGIQLRINTAYTGTATLNIVWTEEDKQ